VQEPMSQTLLTSRYKREAWRMQLIPYVLAWWCARCKIPGTWLPETARPTQARHVLRSHPHLQVCRVESCQLPRQGIVAEVEPLHAARQARQRALQPAVDGLQVLQPRRQLCRAAAAAGAGGSKHLK
jgi:hypothetical protein